MCAIGTVGCWAFARSGHAISRTAGKPNELTSCHAPVLTAYVRHVSQLGQVRERDSACSLRVQTRTSSLGAARPLPPSADIGPGGQSVGQAAQFFKARFSRLTNGCALECGVGFRQLRTCRRTRPGSYVPAISCRSSVGLGNQRGPPAHIPWCGVPGRTASVLFPSPRQNFQSWA